VGRVYQQTFIDTYAKVAFAKLYDRKTPITAAEILNDRVVPFYDEHDIRLSRVLTEAQIQALERAKVDKAAHGEFESECPGYCGAQDTFYMGTLKGVGRIYQQTFIDTYAKVAFAKLYDRK